MKEIEYRVDDKSLADEWFDGSSICMDEIINIIDVINEKYGFNLYNNEEDLDEQKLKQKIFIKYKMILSPYVEQIEELLKSFLITYMYASNPSEFERASAVRQMNRQIRQSQQSINGHDLLAMISYINQNIDNNFITYIANEYAYLRDGNEFMYNPYSERSTQSFTTPEERINAATKEYTQGFINFRYLFETTDSLQFQPVDTEKIIEYGLAIRNCVDQEIKKMKTDHIEYFLEDYINSLKNIQSKLGGKINKT